MTNRRLIVLAGAPDRDLLNWDDNSLVTSYTHAIRRFLGEPPEDVVDTAMSSSASHPPAKWRALLLPDTAPNVHTKSDAIVVDPQMASRSDHLARRSPLEYQAFLEHSLAALENLQSSQIAFPDVEANDTTFQVTSGSFSLTNSEDLSFGTSFESSSAGLDSNTEQASISFNGPWTDLDRIPTAHFLRSIQPQTMTSNILVGVITVQPVRTVQLRRRDAEMDIIEVLCGDDTRAGFSISFWLTPVRRETREFEQESNSIRQELLKLRAGDILLVRNVALGEFRNNVYGQSLSKRFNRSKTTVDVLGGRVSATPAPLAAKLERVRAWTADFVGPSRWRHRSRGDADGHDRKRFKQDELPPNTPPE